MRIEISDQAKSPRLATVHEAGHFVEFAAIPAGPGTQKAVNGQRDWANDPLMAVWRKAVEESEAVKKLRTLDVNGYVMLPLSGRVDLPAEYKTHIEYLLRPQEIWARSYAQYIAVRSGEPKLNAELAKTLEGIGTHELAMTKQWTEDEFKPIASAIDKLFEGLGWCA